MVQYVLDYNQGKDSPAHFGKVHDFKEVLAKIGKVALECLLKDDHVFEYDQLSAAVLCDESLIIALLQVSEYAENLRPAGMVSFIHKSIQEFLAAWFISYRCVPEGNLGGAEQHTRTLKDCQAWESVLQFVCGLSDDGAVKVFQHFTSVRISDPTLDLSKTIPDEENETDVLLCDVTDRHERFSDLVDGSFKEVQSKATLVKHWLDCKAGIILVTPNRTTPEVIPKMTLVNEVASCKALLFYSDRGRIIPPLARGPMLSLYEFEEFCDCLHVPLRITENSAAPLIGDLLRQFKTVKCETCGFDCVLRFHNGKAQFYITGLQLWCDDHARVFTETVTVSTLSCSENSCSKQSCLKFLRSLECYKIVNAQALKNLGVVFRDCKHLKELSFAECGDGMSDLLDQIRNPSTCSLKIGGFHSPSSFFTVLVPVFSLTSVEAQKLAGVLPRFNNIITLNLKLVDCCVATVNKLVSGITHKTLQKLSLCDVSLTPVAAAALGRSLPELSSLEEFTLTGVAGSILQVLEMNALFRGMNKTFPALEYLTVRNFNVRGSFASLIKRVHFFPNLSGLDLSNLNMDKRDFRGLLESLRSIPNLMKLFVPGNPLGSQNRVNSIVKQTLPQVVLRYWVTLGSSTQ